MRPIQRKTPSPEAKKEMLCLLGLTLLFMLVYFGGNAVEVPMVGFIITGAYMLALLGFAVAYIAYNYAFTRKNVTPDMLPETMSAEEKQAFIDKGAEHFSKSRWMIFIIFPLIITFMADVLYLFLWTGFLENFFIK